MSLCYTLFGKVITLDDFVEEAKQKQVAEVHIIPIIKDKVRTRYDSNAVDFEGVHTEYKTDLKLYAALPNDYQLSLRARTLPFGSDYSRGHEWFDERIAERYLKKDRQRNIARNILEMEASYALAEQLQIEGFKINVRVLYRGIEDFKLPQDFTSLPELQAEITKYKTLQERG